MLVNVTFVNVATVALRLVIVVAPVTFNVVALNPGANAVVKKVPAAVA